MKKKEEKNKTLMNKCGRWSGLTEASTAHNQFRCVLMAFLSEKNMDGGGSKKKYIINSFCACC